MKAFARISVFAAAALLAVNASAYNFYLTYDASGNPLPWKWDLTKLTNNTVYFYVADSALDTKDMLPSDGYLPVISELRAAANEWNAVPGSAIQIGYGGLFHSDGTINAAVDNIGINVDFCDCFDSSLLAQSGLTVSTTPAPGATFVPVQLSKLLFPKLPHDTFGNTLASWSEEFYVTAVHEFGHNLGLQHTSDSSAMSTLDTSASSKSRPLAQDDMAGVSYLYPASVAPDTAKISGRVVFSDGTPVNLAPVVAIPAEGDPVEAFTRQDGTYEIDGIPAGLYVLYTQSIPPTPDGYSSRLGLTYPFASDGKTSIPPTCDGGTNCYFETTFYPGTSDSHLAAPLAIEPGTSLTGYNFQVAPRASMPVSGVRSYGYPYGDTVGVFSPPILSYDGAVQKLVLYNPNYDTLPGGIVDANNNLIPGITFDGLGSLLQIVPGTLAAYPNPAANPNTTQAVYMDVVAAFPVPFPGPPGPRHLLIDSPDNVYVLPSALRAVENLPPLITSVQAVGDGTLVINGMNLYGDTRVMFDGIQATTQSVVSGTELIVTPPPAQQGFITHVVALDPDGQSSLFLTGDSQAATYTYPGSAAPALAVTSGSIPAGGSMTVDVIGTNTSFASGETVVGFGTSTVVVTGVNVISRTHLQATATNHGSAAVPTTNINVTTGLSVIASALGYSVTGM